MNNARGWIAEYSSQDLLVAAVNRLKERGVKGIDVYSPYPIEDLSSPPQRSLLPLAPFTLLGAIVGGTSGYFLEWYISVVAYPVNVAGRPLNSPVAFTPVTFECAVLLGAIATVTAFFFRTGMPEPYHPVFDFARFDLAREDAFYLTIPDPEPQREDRVSELRRLLQSTGCRSIGEIGGER